MGDPPCRLRRRLRHARNPGVRGPAGGIMSPGTGNRTTRVLGLAALATVVTVVVLGLVVTPPDEVQGDLVRLIYVHPAVSTWAFVAFGVTALASLLYLWPRTRSRL